MVETKNTTIPSTSTNTVNNAIPTLTNRMNTLTTNAANPNTAHATPTSIATTPYNNKSSSEDEYVSSEWQHQQQPTQEINLFVNHLLEQMQSKFQAVGTTLLSRMDELDSRMEELEGTMEGLLEAAGMKHTPIINSTSANVVTESTTQYSNAQQMTPNKRLNK